MSAGAWVIAAMLTAAIALIACAFRALRPPGKAPLHRRLRARMAGRHVQVPADGEPLSDAEIRAWADVLRDFAGEETRG